METENSLCQPLEATPERSVATAKLYGDTHACTVTLDGSKSGPHRRLTRARGRADATNTFLPPAGSSVSSQEVPRPVAQLNDPPTHQNGSNGCARVGRYTAAPPPSLLSTTPGGPLRW